MFIVLYISYKKYILQSDVHIYSTCMSAKELLFSCMHAWSINTNVKVMYLFILLMRSHHLVRSNCHGNAHTEMHVSCTYVSRSKQYNIIVNAFVRGAGKG